MNKCDCLNNRNHLVLSKDKPEAIIVLTEIFIELSKPYSFAKPREKIKEVK